MLLILLFFYSRKKPDQPFMWLLDRIAIVGALAAAFIRLGNLFNSEIIGVPTDMPWGFVFERLGENFPRHPTQIYESATALMIFFVLYLRVSIMALTRKFLALSYFLTALICHQSVQVYFL